MNKNITTQDYEKIVLNNVPLIDVRAPIEFEKGAFKNSINMPILTNEERHIIGICYKEKGNEEATKLGYSMVSGAIKEERLNKWINYITNNPEAIIYCFRGGSRSTIAQSWINENIKDYIIKLEGGYKGFRNYLINSLEPDNITSKPLVLSGYTGSGKTILLNKLNNSIDLEGIANHRGSTFGHHVSAQPTQINFENNLAYEVVKHRANKFKFMVVEDEGKNMGKAYIPKPFYNYIHNSDVIFLEENIEERITNILTDYVINGQKEFQDKSSNFEVSFKLWHEDMLSSMARVKNKLGGDRLNAVMKEFENASKNQLINHSYDSHRNWIRLFLEEYYDPMYKHSIARGNRNVIFTGNKEEVLEFLQKSEDV